MHATRYKGRVAIFRVALPSFSHSTVLYKIAQPACTEGTLLRIVQHWVLEPAEWHAGKAVSKVPML